MIRRALVSWLPVTLLLLSMAAAPASAASKTLLFGMNVPLSGPAAPVGLGTLRGIELAADDINAAGGIKVGAETYAIKLVVYDSKYDTREGVSIVNRLLFSDKVHHGLTLGGGVTIAIDPIVTENRMLNFTPAYAGAKVTSPKSPYTFRIVPEPEQAFLTLLPWIVKKYGVKTIALTSTDDETGVLQADDAERHAKRLGIPVIDRALAPRGTADFTPMMTKLLAKKPDAIDFGSWAGSDGPRICKQTRELGYRGVYLFSYAQSAPTFLKVAPDCADGALFFGIVGAAPTPLAERVAKHYEDKYKAKFDPLVWRYYDVLWVMKRAMEVAGTTDPSTVKDVMRTVHIDGIFGTTRIGGKSYYGIDAQFLYPIPVSTYSVKDAKWIELYRGTEPDSY